MYRYVVRTGTVMDNLVDALYSVTRGCVPDVNRGCGTVSGQ